MKLTEQKLSIKSILLITILLPVLVIALSSVAIVITARSVQPQDTVSPDFLSDTQYVISAEPKNEEDALTLVSKLFSAAIKSNALKYSRSTDATIKDITCDNESVQELFLFTKGSLEENFSKFYDDEAIRYGENAEALLNILPGSTPSAAECEIGEDRIMQLTLTYDTVFNNMYFLSADTVAIKMFSTENSGVFSVINEKFIPTICEYKLSADTVTGKIISFSVKRYYTYSSNIAFQNTLESIGSTPFTMDISFSENYDFSYAGIEIAEDIITLGKGDYQTLTITPFVEEGLSEEEYSLEFSTYDKYLTIDENGQITAKMIYDHPITVRVTLNYLGQTFYDTCTVYVVEPVESVYISETELTLKRYENYTLSAEVKPEKATIKSIIWHSSDERIATVDEQGNITADMPGAATISAISEQGLIVAKCEVTVTN